MANPNPSPGTDDDTDVIPEREPPAGTPRWMSVVGIIIVVVLVLAIIILHLTGTIGPGAH
jgi:hypothetical protein